MQKQLQIMKFVAIMLIILGLGVSQALAMPPDWSTQHQWNNQLGVFIAGCAAAAVAAAVGRGSPQACNKCGRNIKRGQKACKQHGRIFHLACVAHLITEDVPKLWKVVEAELEGNHFCNMCAKPIRRFVDVIIGTPIGWCHYECGQPMQGRDMGELFEDALKNGWGEAVHTCDSVQKLKVMAETTPQPEGGAGASTPAGSDEEGDAAVAGLASLGL